MKTTALALLILILQVLVPISSASSQTLMDSSAQSSDISIAKDSIPFSNSSKNAISKPSTSNTLKPLEPIYEFISARKFFWVAVIILLTYFGIKILNRIIQFIAEKSTK